MRGFGDVDREVIEELAGRRPRGQSRAAVRREDLDGLLQMSETLKSAKAVGSTPTKAEYDALWEDVDMIHRALVAIARKVGADQR